MRFPQRRRRYLYGWKQAGLIVELQDHSHLSVVGHHNNDVNAIGDPQQEGRRQQDLGMTASEELPVQICNSSTVDELEDAFGRFTSKASHDHGASYDEAVQLPRHHGPSTHQPDIYYPPRHEFSWLACYRYRRNSNSEPSITGLSEELETEPSSFPKSRGVIVRHWKCIPSSADQRLRDCRYSSSAPDARPDNTSFILADDCHFCPPPLPTVDWAKIRTLQLSYLPPTASPGDRASPWEIDLVDLSREPSLSSTSSVRFSPAYIYHFLRSLLSPINAHSPWTAQEAPGDVDGHRNIDVLLLLLPSQSAFQSDLQEFRLSDACPAWYLHSVATMSSFDGALRCMVYRLLPPRLCLSSVHWDTLQPVRLPGCLWEWSPVPSPVKSEEIVSANGVSETKMDGGIESPSYETRLVGPPFYHALTEFPELRPILDQLRVIQEEARAITRWTAWPEEQHYSAGASDESEGGDNADGSMKSVPWTVFPLCYCFPADDVSKRTWVPLTTQAAPRTTDILRRMKSNRLRTALFSRLAPGARLFAHTGWEDLANHVLRVHVPVILPSNTDPMTSLCGLWVDGVVQTLAPGELVCFDDSKMHWAFNYDQEERVVLILDFERPADTPRGTATGGHTEELDRFILQSQGLI